MEKQILVEKMFDIIDSACKLLYEKKKIKYLDGLFHAADYLLQGQADIDIADDEYRDFVGILSEVEEMKFDTDVVRKAMQYLILFAFKEGNIPNYYMTPETVGFLVSYLANKCFAGRKALRIVDLGIGTANMLTTVANSFDGVVELHGVDNNELMVRIAKMNTAMQNYDCIVTLGDILTTPYRNVDLMIGDFDSSFIDDEYFPHLAIKSQWANLENGGYMILVVPSDFFEYPKFELEDMQMVGVIELPDLGAKKIIIIIQKRSEKAKEFLLVKTPSFNDVGEMNQCIIKIEQWFKRRELNE